MHTQGKLKNNFHHKWSTYLHQFHLNIKYKKGSTNNVADYFIRQPIMVLINVPDTCEKETLGWQHLYKSDLELDTTYQMLL